MLSGNCGSTGFKTYIEILVDVPKLHLIMLPSETNPTQNFKYALLVISKLRIRVKRLKNIVTAHMIRMYRRLYSLHTDRI